MPKTIPPTDVPTSKLNSIKEKALLASKNGSITKVDRDYSMMNDKSGKTVWTTAKTPGHISNTYKAEDGTYTVTTNDATSKRDFVSFTDKKGIEYDYQDPNNNGFLDTLKISNQPNVEYHKSNEKSDTYDIRKTYDNKTMTDKIEKYNPETGQYEVEKPKPTLKKPKSMWDNIKDYFK